MVPTDYLQFFCLGKREKRAPDDPSQPVAAPLPQELLQPRVSSGHDMGCAHTDEDTRAGGSGVQLGSSRALPADNKVVEEEEEVVRTPQACADAARRLQIHVHRCVRWDIPRSLIHN